MIILFFNENVLKDISNTFINSKHNISIIEPSTNNKKILFIIYCFFHIFILHTMQLLIILQVNYLKFLSNIRIVILLNVKQIHLR